MSDRFNLTIEQGATLDLPIHWTDDDDETIDLSADYTAKLQVRDRPNGSVLILEASSADATIVLSAGNPNLRVRVPAETTAALTPRVAYYDLEVTNTDDDTVTRLIEGRAVISPGTTL